MSIARVVRYTLYMHASRGVVRYSMPPGPVVRYAVPQGSQIEVVEGAELGTIRGKQSQQGCRHASSEALCVTSCLLGRIVRYIMPISFLTKSISVARCTLHHAHGSSTLRCEPPRSHRTWGKFVYYL